MSLFDHFKRKNPTSSSTNHNNHENNNSSSSNNNGKKQRVARTNPNTIISFNANGFASRIFQNMDSIQNLLKIEDPDIICIQECKLAAHCDSTNAKRGDGKPRRRHALSTSSKKSREEFYKIKSALQEGLLKNYEIYWSLSDWKYAGTAMLIKRDISILSKRYTIPSEKNIHSNKHHKDGRVMIFEFDKFILMNTYAPNNGWDENAFERRRNWDKTILQAMKTEFVKTYGQKPLVWVGDLNVCKTDDDASDIQFYRHGIYQHDKRYTIPMDENDKGQPGCTKNEQKRFNEIINAGNLVDTYRHFHKVGSDENSDNQWSWRGSPPRNFATARYYGKGMRIDYSLVDKRLLEYVKRSDILGHGKERHGFLGSDHSPILLTLDWGK